MAVCFGFKLHGTQGSFQHIMVLNRIGNKMIGIKNNRQLLGELEPKQQSNGMMMVTSLGKL